MSIGGLIWDKILWENWTKKVFWSLVKKWWPIVWTTVEKVSKIWFSHYPKPTVQISLAIKILLSDS